MLTMALRDISRSFRIDFHRFLVMYDKAYSRETGTSGFLNFSERDLWLACA